VGLIEQFHRPRLVMLVSEHGLSKLDVHPQGAERVRENVVDLAGNAGALVQRRCPGLFRAELLRPGGQGR